MKRELLTAALALVLFGRPGFADAAAPKDDWRPASSNQLGREYPQVDAEGRVRFRVVAPQARSVTASFRDGSPFTKGEGGVWIGHTRPLDEGVHYHTINVDGAEAPDPNGMGLLRRQPPGQRRRDPRPRPGLLRPRGRAPRPAAGGRLEVYLHSDSTSAERSSTPRPATTRTTAAATRSSTSGTAGARTSTAGA